MAVFLAPDPINSTQFLPGSNTPATGALLFCYQNKTSTKMNSYSDPTASTANTNPIVLNSGGNPPQEIWIASTATFVLAPSNDGDPPTSPYRTWNDIPGINNVSALIAASLTGEWVQGSTVTFIGVTAFSVVGDQTALYTLGRRIKATVTGGDRFGIVTSSVLAGASTAVGVTLDSSTLNGGLSSVQYGLLSTPNGSVPWTIETSSGINYSNASVTTGSLIATGTVTITSSALNFSAASTVSIKTLSGTQLQISDVVSSVRNIVIFGAASSGTVNISTTAGDLNFSPAGSTTIQSSLYVNSSSIFVGPSSARTGALGIPYGAFIRARDVSNLVDLNIAFYSTVNATSQVLTIGDINNAAHTKIKGGVHAGPPTTSDILSGEWALWRDSVASTTKFYYNNAGTMQSTAAFA